jgi:serine/threonine protein phosphatase PrpC
MSEPAASLQPQPTLIAAAASDRGRVRTGNEDRYHIDVQRGIFLVADGVGGHAAGEVAASIAVDVIVKRLERPLWTAKQRVREAIALANNEIHRQAEASAEYAGMTCVLTLALVSGSQLTIGHVGDSRLYVLTQQGIRKLTHDHSPIGEREDANEISEAEAMRHPRRNEVFRDVGSALHDPDDPDFIEVIETSFDDDIAILLCSDGLSDMLPSGTIDQIVREYAGDPQAVANALVEAANEAGGKDNVTVVYVEAPAFAKGALAQAPPVVRAGVDPAPADQRQERGSGAFASRAMWLTIGVLIGLLGAFGLSAYTTTFDRLQSSRPRGTIVVGGAASSYRSVADAVAAAAPRDVIQIEPGEYAEAITLKDGVDLVARVPGTVTFVAPPGTPVATAITANGGSGNRIEGIRVIGRPNAPIGVAFSLGGHNVAVNDVSVEGSIGVGIEVLNDGAVIVRSSRLSNIAGVPMRLGPASRPFVRHNVFTGTTPVAVQIGKGATPEFVGNVFVGFQEPVEAPVAKWPQFVQQNYLIRGAGHGR